MKTLEEIKAEAATCLTRPRHSACNRLALYNECKGDCGYIIKELYDLVLQLESTNHEQFEKIELLQREKDAAVHDLTESSPCFACKHLKHNGGECSGWNACLLAMTKASIVGVEYTGDKFEWRGPCPENTNQQQEENQGGI